MCLNYSPHLFNGLAASESTTQHANQSLIIPAFWPLCFRVTQTRLKYSPATKNLAFDESASENEREYGATLSAANREASNSTRSLAERLDRILYRGITVRKGDQTENNLPTYSEPQPYRKLNDKDDHIAFNYIQNECLIIFKYTKKPPVIVP